VHGYLSSRQDIYGNIGLIFWTAFTMRGMIRSRFEASLIVIARRCSERFGSLISSKGISFSVADTVCYVKSIIIKRYKNSMQNVRKGECGRVSCHAERKNIKNDRISAWRRKESRTKDYNSQL